MAYITFFNGSPLELILAYRLLRYSKSRLSKAQEHTFEPGNQFLVPANYFPWQTMKAVPWCHHFQGSTRTLQ